MPRPACVMIGRPRSSASSYTPSSRSSASRNCSARGCSLMPHAPRPSARSASASGSSAGSRRQNGTRRPSDAEASSITRSLAAEYPSGSCIVNTTARAFAISSPSISCSALQLKPSGSLKPVCVCASNSSTPGRVSMSAECHGMSRWSAYTGP